MDEEFKGAKPDWYEASDSEDERDKKDMEEQMNKEAKFVFNEAGTKTLASLIGVQVTVIVCSGITS